MPGVKLRPRQLRQQRKSLKRTTDQKTEAFRRIEMDCSDRSCAVAVPGLSSHRLWTISAPGTPAFAKYSVITTLSGRFQRGGIAALIAEVYSVARVSAAETPVILFMPPPTLALRRAPRCSTWCCFPHRVCMDFLMLTFDSRVSAAACGSRCHQGSHRGQASYD